METSSTKQFNINDYLRFIAIVIASLILLSLIFPKDGITVGKITLRFPTIRSVLTKNQRECKYLADSGKGREVPAETADSINYLRSLLFEGDCRIWLPGDNEAFMDRFFAAAEKAQERGSIVRVLHYGDSQIESDRMTGRLRDRLQTIYGGGGPGLIPLQQPIPSYAVDQKTIGNPVGQSTYGRGNFVKANGNYGPMMRSWRTVGATTLTVKATVNRGASDKVKRFSTVRIYFNNRPGPLSVKLTDTKGGTTVTGISKKEGVQSIGWQLDSTTSAITLSLSGQSDIYGVSVDDGAGVAVDNISMRGVSGQQFKMVDSVQLAESYRIMNVGMIIMQFGGNSVPYLKDEKSVAHYCKLMGIQIDYLHNVCPDVPILFIGPSDMSTKVDGNLASYSMLASVVDCLRSTVLEHGAAFWSIYDAMGGEGSMIEWVNGGIAEHDYLHFNHKGANLMGDKLSDIFEWMYELYKYRKR